MLRISGLWSGGRPIQTRVGRRVLVLFMVCAVLPVTVLGVASYLSIADSLREQAFDRSRLSAKRIGSALLERFGNLSSSLGSIATAVSRAPDASEGATSDERFVAIAVTTGNSRRILFGTLPTLPALTARQLRHLESGRTIVTLAGATSNRILMARKIANRGTPQAVIWAEVSDSVIDRLYAAEAASGLRTSSCIVLRDGSVVRCSGREFAQGALAPALTAESAGAFVWRSESGRRYLAGFWSLFLDAEFASQDWRIIFSEPEATILAPLTRFRETFALATVLAILIVALLSTGQIRRSLGPLAALRAGTDRIARLEFDQPVDVKSGDEFEGVARAFNSMSDRVKTQFTEAGRLNDALASKSQVLQDREARLAAILDAAGDAILTIGGSGRIESFNRTAERIFGLTETDAVGRQLNDLFGVPLINGASTLEVGSMAGSPIVEVAGLRRDGATFPAEVQFTEALTGDRILHTVFIRDISERKRGAEDREHLESQLRHAQKMESIGTLAGGIAHDFNNILSPIIMNVELALEGELPAELRGELAGALQGSLRAKDLVKQILLFSRRGEMAFSTIKVTPIVEESLKLLRSSLPSTVEIKSFVAPDVASVSGDPTQLHQVLMNLCINAAHAMRVDGGTLDVRVDVVNIDALVDGRSVKQRAVRLVVRDTGHGMDAATLDRLFEPFFTTKPVGEGTGLGMSIVHGIITQHRGTIAVESTPGAGTVFEIHIPAAEQLPETAEVASAQTGVKGEGRVLIVDDDAVVAQLVARVLARAGYDVAVTSSPSEVVAMLVTAEPPFDLVITDQTMPGMTGLQLAARIMSWRSGFPIILMTGYSEFGGRQDARQHGLREILMKPVPIAVLTASVARVLNEERSTIRQEAARVRVPETIG